MVLSSRDGLSLESVEETFRKMDNNFNANSTANSVNDDERRTDIPKRTDFADLPLKHPGFSQNKNVGGQASAEEASLASSAEKRRNKLGYYKTSGACGKCNRKEIAERSI